MKFTRSKTFQALAFALVTLTMTTALVAAGSAAGVEHEGPAACLFCTAADAR